MTSFTQYQRHPSGLKTELEDATGLGAASKSDLSFDTSHKRVQRKEQDRLSNFLPYLIHEQGQVTCSYVDILIGVIPKSQFSVSGTIGQ